MANTNLEWAMGAYVHCVTALERYGSDNKRFRETQTLTAEDYARKIQQNLAIKQVLKPAQPTGANVTMADVVGYGQKAFGQQAGNCFEHAAVAASYLAAQNGPVPVFDVVQIPNLDHAFVVIGEPKPAVGDYPMLFANWSYDAAICDGWARICCPARDYAELWDITMNNWHAGGLEVPLGDQKWGSATTYRGAVERDPRQSYIVAGPPKKQCLIATAACNAMGLDEQCYELTTLRAFRDQTLLADPAWAEHVGRYYAMAPAALDAISRLTTPVETLSRVYTLYVAPAVRAIEQSRPDQAKAIFRSLLRDMTAVQHTGAIKT